jgi:predicted lipoprotein with Yx(FWY)xxD motif
LLAAALALTLSVPTAFAQQAAKLQVQESEEYGEYFTDGAGRTLYLFTADTRGQADTLAKSACEGPCAGNWPPFTSAAEPEAGEGVREDMIATISRRDDGTEQVTYNGWPLYRFVQDREVGEIRGQDVDGFGGEWYLISPSGKEVRAQAAAEREH